MNFVAGCPCRNEEVFKVTVQISIMIGAVNRFALLVLHCLLHAVYHLQHEIPTTQRSESTGGHPQSELLSDSGDLAKGTSGLPPFNCPLLSLNSGWPGPFAQQFCGESAQR